MLMRAPEHKKVLILTPAEWLTQVSTSTSKCCSLIEPLAEQLAEYQIELLDIKLDSWSSASDLEPVIEMLDRFVPDGVIITRLLRADPIVGLLISRCIPFVVLDHPGEVGLDCSFAGVDGTQAFYQLTEHLIKLGHHDIALLNADPGYRYAFTREQGVRQALNDHGLELNPEWYLFGETSASIGHLMATRLLTQERAPTAFICANSRIAAGAVAAAESLGYQVGPDLSIVSYGALIDSDQAQHLTTLTVDYHRVATGLANIMVAKLLYSDRGVHQIIVPGYLRAGSSSAPPPNRLRTQQIHAAIRNCQARSERGCNNLFRLQGLYQQVQRLTRTGGWSYDVGRSRFYLSDEAKRVLMLDTRPDYSFDQLIRNLSPLQRGQFLRNWYRASLSGRSFNAQLTLARGGRNATVQMLGDFVFDQHGKLICAEGSLQDLSVQTKLIERLQSAVNEHQTQLSHNNELWATVSHEIRTPLNAMLAQLKLLREQLCSTDIEPDLISLEGSARLLQTTLNSVLDHAKMESEAIEILPEAFSLRALLDGVKSLFTALAQSRGDQIFVSIDARVADHLKGDPHLLKQILNNLVSNALKFTEKGQILISVQLESRSPAGVGLKFSVSDSGIGMNAEQQKRLFKAFQQADKTTARDFGGTGLGLSICRRLVHAMGGSISVDSAPNNGSRFTFALEFELADESTLASELSAEAHSALIPDAPLRGLRILVVDDNRTNTLLAQKVLSKLGAQAESVASGSEALAWLTQGQCDLVLLDLRMPGMDGFEVSRRIRAGEVSEANRQVPVLLMSASESTEITAQALAVGINATIEKNFDAALLSKQIINWVTKDQVYSKTHHPTGQPLVAAERVLRPFN